MAKSKVHLAYLKKCRSIFVYILTPGMLLPRSTLLSQELKACRHRDRHWISPLLSHGTGVVSVVLRDNRGPRSASSPQSSCSMNTWHRHLDVQASTQKSIPYIIQTKNTII